MGLIKFLQTRLENEAKLKLDKAKPLETGNQVVARAEVYYCTSEGKVAGEL